MALLNKLFLNIGKKKPPEKMDELNWESYPLAASVKVRVILFRECDNKGKKLLFDSNSVERTPITADNRDIEQFTEVNDGHGFTYTLPDKDVKMFSEMILGSVAVNHQTGNMKLHSLEEGKSMLWSSIFPAPKISHGVKSSDASLGSSFGCSVGSFHSELEDFGVGMVPPDLDGRSTRTDSGYFPSYPSSNNITSSFVSATGSSQHHRRLSSNVDMPDFGSLCSLQKRFQSALESGASLKQSSEQVVSSVASSAISLKDQSYKSGSEISSLSSRLGGRKNVLLGLGLKIDFADAEGTDVLLRHDSVLEDIYSHLLHRVNQAYTRKKRFVITMHDGFLDAARMLNDLFSVPRLKLSTWLLSIKENPSESLQGRLASEICRLKNRLDTKETNFFFSTLMTGVLSHHLGWVSTVMPGSMPGSNILHKPGIRGLEQFRLEQWYDPTKVQYKELHGMLGFPMKLAKSLLLSADQELLKSLIFVISYFIRCSLVFETVFDTESSSLEVEPEPIKCKSYVLREVKERESDQLEKSSQGSSSVRQGNVTVEPEKRQQDDRKVGFLLGADDSSPDSKPSSQSKESRHSPMEKETEVNQIYLTEVPFVPSQPQYSDPTDLPALICTAKEYMPGSVLQGLCVDSSSHWKSQLQADLLAVAGNSLVSSLTEECICVVGDVDNYDVSLVSAQQVVVGRPGLPLPMSPMVAGLLENFTATIELGLPVEDCLNYLEDQLQQVYLESCSLSEYLLSTDYTSLQNITKSLQVDASDVPLLLAVASTHTPAVGKKLSLGFTG